MTQPYGTWASPIRAESLAEAGLRISQTRIRGRSVYWLEGRPTEKGRQQLMCVSDAFTDSPPVAFECSPREVNVRTLVHEYGGGDYQVIGDRVFYVDFSDQRIYWQEGGESRPLSPPGARYADFAVSSSGDWLLAVEETPRAEGEPTNRLVAFAIARMSTRDAGEAPRVIAEGHDFYSFPVFSQDGSQLAYTAWDHPNMPWDGTTLYLQAWGSQGPGGTAQAVAGGKAESVFQPLFSPGGVLTFVSDRSGWWNLYQLRPRGIVALCPRAEEFAGPQWVFGLSRYGFLGEAEILCVHGHGGRSRLARLQVESGRLVDLDLPYTGFEGLRVDSGRACFIAAGPAQLSTVVSLDLADGRLRELCQGASLDFDDSLLVAPQAFEFSSQEGRRAHAWFYPPAAGRGEGPAGERPPLLVKSHGGPTAAASAALDLRIQYWVSRGIAVVDVDYGGSTGYGREYRERLRGQWGIVDVEDCVHAARSLAAEGAVDAERLAISGGSAGGYTTLCALTFHDTFRAGASLYGIGDLEALARDTHKFESHYTDGLVGPYPEAVETYRARSPIHSCERLNCPVIFFQGLEDKIVPPGQAEAMVSALAAQGIPHAYVPFEGEQHGFRQARNIQQALEGELYFYGQIFGFHPDAEAGRVRIAR
ncbi:MAG: prolyl oligopeptidase family serine peptidase [Myxococcota bacterium]|nr:prolyl oligopeptidase family serine peptidase [Myxococcota bacterium]